MARSKDHLKVKVIWKKMKNKEDSFWYEGDIALLSYKDREVLVVAAGDIRIHDKTGELVWDCKPRNGGFPEFKNYRPNTDRQLHRLEKLGYYFDMNNWFEWLWRVKGDTNWDCILGDVAYEYDDAMSCAKWFIKCDEWWNGIIEKGVKGARKRA